MTKPQALDLLMLLSALESWAFSTGKPLPDYLLERLDVALAVVTRIQDHATICTG